MCVFFNRKGSSGFDFPLPRWYIKSECTFELTLQEHRETKP